MFVAALLPAQLQLFLLAAIPLISYKISQVKDLVNKLSVAFDTLFKPSHYVFFDNSYFPYTFHITNTWATGSAPVHLMYDADKRIFFPKVEGLTFQEVIDESKHMCIPILSLEIVGPDGKVHYDLTDFLESLRFVQVDDSPAPRIQHVLAVWTLASGIVPDWNRFKLSYFDETGENIVCSAWDLSDSDSKDSTDSSETEASGETVVATSAAEAAAEES